MRERDRQALSRAYAEAFARAITTLPDKSEEFAEALRVGGMPALRKAIKEWGKAAKTSIKQGLAEAAEVHRERRNDNADH